MKGDIISACIGGVDKIKDNQCPNPDFNFIHYTDNSMVQSDLWEVRYREPILKDPRRSARKFKWLIHKYSNAEYSLWIDSNVIILTDVSELIEEYLNDFDIALMSHPNRGCIYEEFDVCIASKLDRIGIMQKQMDSYREKGYPENNGLHQTRVILRRHTPKVKKLNEAVWAEIKNGSVRDQLCFDYVVWKLGVQVNTMSCIVASSKLFDHEVANKVADNDRHKFLVIKHKKQNRIYPQKESANI